MSFSYIYFLQWHHTYNWIWIGYTVKSNGYNLGVVKSVLSTKSNQIGILASLCSTCHSDDSNCSNCVILIWQGLCVLIPYCWFFYRFPQSTEASHIWALSSTHVPVKLVQKQFHCWFDPSTWIKMDILREFLESSTIHGLTYISTAGVSFVGTSLSFYSFIL